MNHRDKKTQIVMAVACAFLGLTFAINAGAQNQALGMVLNVEGDVSIQHGATKKAAKRIDFLYASDKLVVSKGRADVLVCTSPERWALAAGAALEFAPGSVKQTAGPASERKPAKCLLPDIKVEDKDRLRFGGLAPRGLPAIALLLGGPVTQARPSFDWIGVKDAQSYEVAVRDDTGELLWEAKAKSTHLDYPSAEAALKSEKYEWEVKAMVGNKIIAQQIATLDVKPNQELSKPAPANPADILLLAGALENAKYFSEAASLYRRLRALDANDSRLGYHLVWLYGNAGLIAAAREELLKLDPAK